MGAGALTRPAEHQLGSTAGIATPARNEPHRRSLITYPDHPSHYFESMTFYRRDLPHLQRGNKPHFITFITKHRAHLPPAARDIVLQCCRHDHNVRYHLHAAVVMPDHVHLILTPIVDPQRMLVVPLPEIMKAIKSTAAHRINRRRESHAPVWQDESFDHVLRSSEALDAKVLYVLENPVRRGLVSRWEDYPWVLAPSYIQPVRC